MSNRPEKINLSDVHSRQVDIDLLNELRDLFVKAEEQKERYDFTWNGKAKAYFEAAAPTTKTLRVQPEESVNFEKSENLFITGDNLEALKLLQESYLGKIDMIYMDPPYNTGTDLVYHDNFKRTKKSSEVSEGKIDDYGTRLVKNDNSNGRYHSDWLTMIYPRLKLSRNLLSDSGVIFVSIDDREQANLKLMMDEIFGQNSFIAEIIVDGTPKNDPLLIATSHEYLLVYVKNKEQAKKMTWGKPHELTEDILAIIKDKDHKIAEKDLKKFYEENGLKSDNISNYKYVDDLGVYRTGPLDDPQSRGPKDIRINMNTGNPLQIPTRGWSSNTATWNKWVSKKLIKFPDNDTQLASKKTYLSKDKLEVGRSVLKMQTRSSTEILAKLFDGKKIFTNPKPIELIKYIVSLMNHDSPTILDLFAGSSTTADAVMQLNLEDKGSRKFIMVTLDENLDDTLKKSTGKAKKVIENAINVLDENQFPHTLDYISRERIRRAAEKIGDKTGFRALKVDSTGLKEDIFKTAGELDQLDLLQDIDNHSDIRSDYDLLYDVLVDGALEYNRPITIDNMNNEKIIKYDYLGELSGVVCYFGGNLTDELTRQIATLKPLIAVFKESTFDKSAQKVNVIEQFRIISPDTKVKVI
ncbi:site-specific DNA-methyltransferase [Enterococcus durans]|uniref:site-specific DNA-methyltransferase n=1 Tax=Enterococcus durans TaxID=53345 RepID=UPI00242AEE57|nr:site-specific DNA-methyltransferase [Enterococcus durans]